MHLISPVYQLHLLLLLWALVSCICIHGCDVIAIENESENEDLDLLVLSVTMSETRVIGMVKREKARLALKS